MAALPPTPATEQYVEDDDDVVRDRAFRVWYIVVAVTIVTFVMWLVVMPFAEDVAESFRQSVRPS